MIIRASNMRKKFAAKNPGHAILNLKEANTPEFWYENRRRLGL